MEIDKLNDIRLLSEKLQPIVNMIIKNIIVYHNLPVEVYETFRSAERQKKLYELKETSAQESQHTTGDAVDFAVRVDGNWILDNNKYDYYLDFLGIKVMELFDDIEWGGVWSGSVQDKKHFFLKYKAKKEEDKKEEEVVKIDN